MYFYIASYLWNCYLTPFTMWYCKRTRAFYKICTHFTSKQITTVLTVYMVEFYTWIYFYKPYTQQHNNITAYNNYKCKTLHCKENATSVPQVHTMKCKQIFGILILIHSHQVSQTHSPPGHFMQPMHWSYYNYRTRPTAELNNFRAYLFFGDF
jgi:hypothetical protein